MKLTEGDIDRMIECEKRWLEDPDGMWEKYFEEMKSSGYEHLIDRYDYCLYRGKLPCVEKKINPTRR